MRYLINFGPPLTAEEKDTVSGYRLLQAEGDDAEEKIRSLGRDGDWWWTSDITVRLPNDPIEAAIIALKIGDAMPLWPTVIDLRDNSLIDLEAIAVWGAPRCG